MMSSTLIVFISVTTMAILCGETFATLPPQCDSGFLEELPPRLRKICIAFARIWGAREMNDFVDDREYRERENYPQVKRQDVDHVFLRFGRKKK